MTLHIDANVLLLTEQVMRDMSYQEMVEQCKCLIYNEFMDNEELFQERWQESMADDPKGLC